MTVSKKNGEIKKRKAIHLIERTARNIRYLRIKNKLSQEDLEVKTRLPISRYESGKHNMTLTTIDILSKHLGVEAWQLLK